jgi:hypothetical protein
MKVSGDELKVCEVRYGRRKDQRIENGLIRDNSKEVELTLIEV